MLPSPKRSPGKESHNRFLAALAYHHQLHIPFQDIHGAIRRFAHEKGMRCFFTELGNPSRNPGGFEIDLRIEGIRKLRFYVRLSGLFNESAVCELARLDATDRCVGRPRSFRNSGTHMQCRPAERLVSGQLQTRNPVSAT